MMSSGTVRRVSRQDIQLVQNLIEICLQLYMNQKEVVETLLVEAKIEPGFTELVWQKLEEENGEFFKAYYLRLMLKHQIIEFNKLLEQQVQLMHQVYPTGVAPLSTSNGTHIPQLHVPQNSACYPEHSGSAVKPEKIQHPAGPSLTNAFINSGSSLHTSIHPVVDMSAQTIPHLGFWARFLEISVYQILLLISLKVLIYWIAMLDHLSWQQMQTISSMLTKEESKEKIEG